MPSVAAESAPSSFKREPLAHELANAFAGSGANAEQLIDAAQLQYSQELAAAQLLAHDREHELTKADLAKALEIPEDRIPSFSKRGNYVIYAYETPDGRVYKDAALLDGEGNVEVPDRPDSPQRAALRAAIEARGKIENAKSEAEKLIAEAREKAAAIIAEAAAKARGEQRDRAEQAAEEYADAAEKGELEGDDVSDQVAGGRERPSETAGSKSQKASGGGARRTG